uniref:Uncharacterized protein n=1 Tax=Anguilla anguilla TaxID=7936 RepID=A0A0E9TFJ0_ANGAN
MHHTPGLRTCRTERLSYTCRTERLLYTCRPTVSLPSSRHERPVLS